MTEKNRSPPLSDGTSTEAIEPVQTGNPVL